MAPTGTVFACTDSGWIDSDVFTQWMKHFIQSVNSSKENKHLLLLDGHTSHSKNLDTIKLARENGVYLLSFPPHTTHRMQPLDVSFFKSLKSWYNIEVETYLRSSNGKTVNVYLVSKLVGKAFVKAATMESAVNGFRKAGLWPPNRHVFDGEFDRIEALTAPYTDALTGCQTTPSNGRGEENGSTSEASDAIHVDNDNATIGPAYAMPTTSSTTPDCNVGVVRSPNEQPNTANTSPAHCTIHTQGDGRCFFRSVVIGLNCDLQSAQRNPVTGVIIDTMKSLLETARADNLRTMVISHMCEKVCVEADAAVLSADMPEHLQFNTLAEHIVHMSDPKSMVGELEVQNTAEVLGRPIHVTIAPGNHIVEYVPKNVCDKDPLLVKYLPHQDAGHYECIVGLSVTIRDISPLPNIYGSKRNISGSKSQILTSSPYKDALELKKRQNRRRPEQRMSRPDTN